MRRSKSKTKATVQAKQKDGEMRKQGGNKVKNPAAQTKQRPSTKWLPALMLALLMTFSSIAQPLTAFAAFNTDTQDTQDTLLILFQPATEGGRLYAQVNGEYIESGDKIPAGVDILFTAIPDPGFRIDTWGTDFLFDLGRSDGDAAVGDVSYGDAVFYEDISAEEDIRRTGQQTMNFRNIRFGMDVSVWFYQYDDIGGGDDGP
ncbi:MAG: hypothetical protein FWC74_09340, partial [Candidatus Bathyarchaeota archaeon]|nr:hypothetical protein [Candidatus Termitimicrobium sp.]